MIQNWYKTCNKCKNPEDFSESNQESTQAQKTKRNKINPNQNKPAKNPQSLNKICFQHDLTV